MLFAYHSNFFQDMPLYVAMTLTFFILKKTHYYALFVCDGVRHARVIVCIMVFLLRSGGITQLENEGSLDEILFQIKKTNFYRCFFF